MRRSTSLLLVCLLALGCKPAIPRSEGWVPVAPGMRLHYVALGNGPDTVVVLHGGPGLHSKYLLKPLEALAIGRTLIFYDQRGRGLSDSVADTLALSADSDVADLGRVREHFGLRQLTLIGHHWGAAVAALYAVRYPEAVKRILMLSPFFVHASFNFELAMLPTDTVRARLVASDRARLQTPEQAVEFCRADWPVYFSPIPPDPKMPEASLGRAICDAPASRLYAVERVNRAVLRSLGYWSWRVALHDVRVPVLVMEGKGPELVEAAATRWAQHLPNARLDLVRPPYLFPWIGDRNGFLRDSEAFLRGAWPGSAVKPPPFVAPALPAASSLSPSPADTAA